MAGKSTVIVLGESKVLLLFILGILNSRITTFAFRRMYDSISLQGGYLRIGPPQVRTIPVPAVVQQVKHVWSEFSLLKDNPLDRYRAFIVAFRAHAPVEPELVSDAFGFIASCAQILMDSRPSNEQQTLELDLLIDSVVGWLYGFPQEIIDKMHDWYDRDNPQTSILIGVLPKSGGASAAQESEM